MSDIGIIPGVVNNRPIMSDIIIMCDVIDLIFILLHLISDKEPLVPRPNTCKQTLKQITLYKH